MIERITDMRCLPILLALTLALSAVAVCAADKSSAREVYIFRGSDPDLDGVDLGEWGSGSAVKSKEKVFDGAWSVKIKTQGLYSGGRMDFTRPITLFKGDVDKSRYLQFTFFFDDVTRVDPARGTDYAWDVEPYTIPKAAMLRFVFESEDGVRVEAEKFTGIIDPDDNWMRVAVPLTKLQTKEEFEEGAEEGIDEFRLSRMIVSADIPTTMYLGEVKLATDTSPISVESLDTQSLAVMDTAFWIADADGGVSSLKYSWDFDAANGIQEESDSMVGRYIYTMSRRDAKGNDLPFTVTLTVSDADGIKEPVTLTTTIEISD